jgi:large subunit ribosomal protein L13e
LSEEKPSKKKGAAKKQNKGKPSEPVVEKEKKSKNLERAEREEHSESRAKNALQEKGVKKRARQEQKEKGVEQEKSKTQLRPMSFLKPIVKGKFRLSSKIRPGKGFSLSELRMAGLSLSLASKLKILVDRRRKSFHQENIDVLKSALQEAGIVNSRS